MPKYNYQYGTLTIILLTIFTSGCTQTPKIGDKPVNSPAPKEIVNIKSSNNKISIKKSEQLLSLKAQSQHDITYTNNELLFKKSPDYYALNDATRNQKEIARKIMPVWSQVRAERIFAPTNSKQHQIPLQAPTSPQSQLINPDSITHST